MPPRTRSQARNEGKKDDAGSGTCLTCEKAAPGRILAPPARLNDKEIEALARRMIEHDKQRRAPTPAPTPAPTLALTPCGDDYNPSGCIPHSVLAALHKKHAEKAKTFDIVAAAHSK